MPPAIYNLTCTQGDDFLQLFIFKGRNLAGYTSRMQIRKSPGDQDEPLASLTPSITAETATVTVTMNAETTAAFNVPDQLRYPAKINYVYDLELIDPNGLTKTELGGTFTVIAQVTR